MSAPARSATAPDAEPHAGARCLVVGYDRGESAREALLWAARQLSGEGRLVIVFAERPLHVPQSPVSTPEQRRHFAGAAIDELLLTAGEEVLDRRISTEISEEDPVTALREAARRYEADAIVLGARQHSRLHEAIGTVTGGLLKDSPVPVTVVPCRSADGDPLPPDSF